MEFKDFEVIEEDLVYKGRIFDLRTHLIRPPEGKDFRLDIVHHPGAVIIVPQLENGKLILIKQFRFATKQFIWEFPAGCLHKGEDPGECAKRELIEEVGYEAGKMEKLLAFYTTPGMCNEYMHLFLATDLKQAESNLEEDEFLQVEEIEPEKVQRMIDSGEIIDAKTILAFLYFNQKK